MALGMEKRCIISERCVGRRESEKTSVAEERARVYLVIPIPSDKVQGKVSGEKFECYLVHHFIVF